MLVHLNIRADVTCYMASGYMILKKTMSYKQCIMAIDIPNYLPYTMHRMLIDPVMILSFTYNSPR